ncbi:MAG: hypothetical protein EPO21_08130 [Chloroflexota bacterium]|nr:MAG: hypothetical protein EPO21_08130 [Chloroflexota bacterium]
MVDKARARRVDLILPARAQTMGLRTATDAKVAFIRQSSHWWNGTNYYCPLCDQEFHGSDCAAHHLVTNQHPVLRWELAVLPDRGVDG